MAVAAAAGQSRMAEAGTCCGRREAKSRRRRARTVLAYGTRATAAASSWRPSFAHTTAAKPNAGGGAERRLTARLSTLPLVLSARGAGTLDVDAAGCAAGGRRVVEVVVGHALQLVAGRAGERDQGVVALAVVVDARERSVATADVDGRHQWNSEHALPRASTAGRLDLLEDVVGQFVKARPQQVLGVVHLDAQRRRRGRRDAAAMSTPPSSEMPT